LKRYQDTISSNTFVNTLALCSNLFEFHAHSQNLSFGTLRRPKTGAERRPKGQNVIPDQTSSNMRGKQGLSIKPQHEERDLRDGKSTGTLKGKNGRVQQTQGLAKGWRFLSLEAGMGIQVAKTGGGAGLKLGLEKKNCQKYFATSRRGRRKELQSKNSCSLT